MYLKLPILLFFFFRFRLYSTKRAEEKEKNVEIFVLNSLLYQEIMNKIERGKIMQTLRTMSRRPKFPTSIQTCFRFTQKFWIKFLNVTFLFLYKFLIKGNLFSNDGWPTKEILLYHESEAKTQGKGMWLRNFFFIFHYFFFILINFFFI